METWRRIITGSKKWVSVEVFIELGNAVQLIRAVKNSNLHMETEFLCYCQPS